MHSNGIRFVFVLGVLWLAGGCSSTNAGGSEPGSVKAQNEEMGFAIKIDSDPSGADVFAMGEKIGTTPLVISSHDIFPSQYPKEKELLYGTLTLRKTGCNELVRTVDKKLVLMRAKLQCGEIKATAPEKPRVAPDAGGNAEQRLTRIKELLDKGLITEEEAKKARERIINEL